MTNLQKEIMNIKKDKNIKILAHNYQTYDIQQIADYVGDSFYLSKISQELDCDTVVFCGVNFMAETTKMLSPDKKVILANEEAYCPMARMISPDDIIKFREENPDYTIVSYVNSTTETKAHVDVCVTSSTALKIMNQIENKNILFVPDENLGNYIAKKIPDKNIKLWEGYCNVHDRVTTEEVYDLREKHPNALLLVHPECREEIVNLADFAGSTSEIIKQAIESPNDEIIIGTEVGVLEFLEATVPNKKFYLLSKHLVCPNMKKTKLEDVYKAVSGEGGREVVIEEELMNKAIKSINEMIRLAE
jgi:quinolinate synthase